MNYKRNLSNPNKAVLVVIPLLLFAAAVIIIVSLAGRNRRNATTAAGVEYIKTMEAKDTVEIENAIFNASRQKLLDEMQERLDADPDEVWKILKELNTVMMGDSRVVGFDVFGFMDESHVIASAGATIRLIPDSYEVLQVLNPNLLLLSYGLNDINNYWLWDTLDEYIAELNETVAELYELLPNTYIYVQSIIPATYEAVLDSPGWGEIPNWNAAIKADCEEHGFRYLDLTPVVEEHYDLYDLDGVHMQYYFYPYWAEALLMQYIKDSGME